MTATNNINLRTEWPDPWGSKNWKMEGDCRFVLPQDYTPHTNPSGFRMKLTLDSQATGAIEVRYCFAFQYVCRFSLVGHVVKQKKNRYPSFLEL